MSVVIIGGGHGGASAAFELRRAGYTAPVTIVGEETAIPYQRPPLSKAWLKGTADEDSLILRPRAWYSDNNVSLRLASRAESISREDRSVALAGGSVIPFDHLIIASGARARQLKVPGSHLAGVLMLRTMADADQLKQSFRPGARIAIIGGGYVGLETAASARALNAEVIVLEREPRLLARVACPALSEFFMTVHRAEGVQFQLDADVVRFLGDTRVHGLELSDGRVIDCDAAVVGIGAIPNDEIARACGLECADGIVVDQHARTADPAIFAIGDVTRRPVARYDRQVRLESVPNAIEQAKQAAAAICGRPAPAAELPWFWSDQYDMKLQIAGMAFDCDDIVVRGNPANRSFAMFHLRDRVLQAVEAVNSPAEFMFGKSLIARRLRIVREKLADPAVPIREVAA
jgi:3-phenylpropionate/trans-cinnamate dioxygenase ferredoxin reductase subunit